MIASNYLEPIFTSITIFRSFKIFTISCKFGCIAIFESIVILLIFFSLIVSDSNKELNLFFWLTKWQIIPPKISWIFFSGFNCKKMNETLLIMCFFLKQNNFFGQLKRYQVNKKTRTITIFKHKIVWITIMKVKTIVKF